MHNTFKNYTHDDNRLGMNSMADDKTLVHLLSLFIILYCVEWLIYVFSALTLLVGRQEGHPACEKLSGGVLAWLSVWSEMQTCIWPS